MPATIATAGKIVATVRSPAVARLRDFQTAGTSTNETAPYAAAIAKSGTALKSSVFVSIDTGPNPDDRGGTSRRDAWAKGPGSSAVVGFPLAKIGRAAYSQFGSRRLPSLSLGDANRGARTWPSPR